MTKKVLAIDPGVTSGFAWANVDMNKFFVSRMIRKGEFSYGDQKTIGKVLSFARQADVIVLEDFVVRQSLIGDRLLTVRMIGLFELTFRNKVIFQQPAQKAEFPESSLTKPKFWHKSLHVRDAIRHLLIYIHSQRRVKTPHRGYKQRPRKSRLSWPRK